MGLRSTTWTTTAGGPEAGSGEGLASRAAMAPVVTVADAAMDLATLFLGGRSRKGRGGKREKKRGNGGGIGSWRRGCSSL